MLFALRSVVPAVFVVGLIWAASVPTAVARAEQEAATAPAGDSGLTPSYLRCEYRADPLGIDVRAPRLSWIVESSGRGQKQTAYQVLVAGDVATLGRDQGDLWDSGTGRRATRPRRSSMPARPCDRTSRASGRSGSGTRMAAPRPGASPRPGPWDCSNRRIGARPSGSAPTSPGRSSCRKLHSTGPSGSGMPATRAPNKPQGHRLFVTTPAIARIGQGRKGRADRDGRRLLPVHDQRQPRHQRPARHGRLGPPQVRRRDHSTQARGGEHDPRRGATTARRARRGCSPS